LNADNGQALAYVGCKIASPAPYGPRACVWRRRRATSFIRVAPAVARAVWVRSEIACRS
jgi:hypothetical protein